VRQFPRAPAASVPLRAPSAECVSSPRAPAASVPSTSLWDRILLFPTPTWGGRDKPQGALR
jgi:hypothetical protein